MNIIDKRVARGAAILDAARPGWREAVDVNDLHLSDYIFCILGQLYGSFTAGVETLTEGVVDGAAVAWAIDAGFEAAEDDAAEYESLTEAWRVEVAR